MLGEYQKKTRKKLWKRRTFEVASVSFSEILTNS
jgi:hypothetical protein